jgi:hypothetical protein
MSAPIVSNSIITKVTSVLDAVTTAPTKGTPAVDVMYYSLDNQYMHLTWSFTEDADSEAGSGIYKITIPDSYEIDANFINIGTDVTSNVAGQLVFNDDDGAVVGYVTAYDATSLAMVVDGAFIADNNLGLDSAKAPVTYNVKAIIPITNRNYIY